MWIEIVNNEGQTIGAVNSEGCDLIRIGSDGGAGHALIRNVNAIPTEVYKTRISYLRLIEAITQSEAEGLKQLAEVVASAEEAKGDRAAPRIVLV